MIDLLGRVPTAALDTPDAPMCIFDFIELRNASLSPRLQGRRRHIVQLDDLGNTTVPKRTAYSAGIVAVFQRDVTRVRPAGF